VRLQAVAPVRDTAATHLRRMGVNPITVERLKGYAAADDMTLTELVRFILSDYAPGYLGEPSDPSNVVSLADRGE